MISQRYIVVMCVPVICLVLGTLTGAAQGGSDAAPVRRISHILPEGQQFTIVGSPLVALSPDTVLPRGSHFQRLAAIETGGTSCAAAQAGENSSFSAACLFLFFDRYPRLQYDAGSCRAT